LMHHRSVGVAVGGGALIVGGLATGGAAQATTAISVEVSSTSGAAAPNSAATTLLAKGKETLADAIFYLDNTDHGGTITFASSLSGTIHLTADLPPITTDTVITGPGAGKLAISGGGTHTTFDVPSTANLTLSGLTVEDSGADDVFDDRGNLTITGSVLESAKQDAIQSGSYHAYTPNITLSGDAIKNNDGAGVVLSNDGTLKIARSLIEDNGSGVHIYGSPTTITRSSIVGNGGPKGGGYGGIRDNAYYGEGLVTIINSTISGNTLHQDKESYVSGGGIGLASGVSLTLIGDTVTNNRVVNADTDAFTGAVGGGISMGLIFPTSVASMLTVDDSVVAGNGLSSPNGAAGEHDPDISIGSKVTSLVKYSLIGVGATAADTGKALTLRDATQSGTSKKPLNPKLDGIGPQGSKTATAGGALLVQVPQKDSHLLGKGAAKIFNSTLDPFTTDELGTARPDTNATIGAYQVPPKPKKPTKPKPKPTA
jgi:parallel beta helix pectate lyase-like protein